MAAASVPATVSWAATADAVGRARLGGSAHVGQWTAGTCGATEFRTALGGQGFLEFIGEGVRLTMGGRVMREHTQSTSGDGATPPGRGDVQMAASILAAARHRYFELGLGVGYLRWADVGHQTKGTVLPAATVRAGPEWLYASTSLLDFSAESLGLGVLKAGLGGEIGPVDLFGGLGVQPHLGGPTLGVMCPVARGFRMRADALLGGDDGGHFSFEAALGVTYEFADDPFATP